MTDRTQTSKSSGIVPEHQPAQSVKVTRLERLFLQNPLHPHPSQRLSFKILQLLFRAPDTRTGAHARPFHQSSLGGRVPAVAKVLSLEWNVWLLCQSDAKHRKHEKMTRKIGNTE